MYMYTYTYMAIAEVHTYNKPGDSNGMSLSKLPALSSQPIRRIG